LLLKERRRLSSYYIAQQRFVQQISSDTPKTVLQTRSKSNLNSKKTAKLNSKKTAKLNSKKTAKLNSKQTAKLATDQHKSVSYWPDTELIL
jgi:hypothetical protein